ncbi:signal peptidase II [Mobilitalea sibirica]|uniref:Lipoprotein signal peptidase n=1 Tax=Mobilitalea sibirica TaxID=1462919 RepID=A0A8J7HCY7_9FIRM|nr:signal peptidase II [Mobilitalea sibirica]MBH1942551.1 signal peptidase II [Mobilitalea sibirica]
MLYIFLIVAIVILETKIKNYIEKNRQIGQKEEILGGKIILKKQYNRGMFLNFLEDKKDLVIKISGIFLGILLIVFTILLPKKHNKLLKLGLALCLGGAISNMADRINRGYVVDYFSFNCKMLKSVVFNLADIFILLGSILVILSSTFSSKGKGCTYEPTE